MSAGRLPIRLPSSSSLGFSLPVWLGLIFCFLMAYLSSGVEAQAPQEKRKYTVDDSEAGRIYANFFRVTGTPEEMIIDLGLNPQGKPTDKPIIIDQRIIMSYYNAKRLQSALETSVKRHEQLFGEIETDIKKRLRQNQGDLKST